MAQKTKVPKQIPDEDFERITELILKEDEQLLKMLAGV